MLQKIKNNQYFKVFNYVIILAVYLTGVRYIATWVSENIGDYDTSGSFFGLITLIVLLSLFPYNYISIDKEDKEIS